MISLHLILELESDESRESHGSNESVKGSVTSQKGQYPVSPLSAQISERLRRKTPSPEFLPPPGRAGAAPRSATTDIHRSWLVLMSLSFPSISSGSLRISAGFCADSSRPVASMFLDGVLGLVNRGHLVPRTPRGSAGGRAMAVPPSRMRSTVQWMISGSADRRPEGASFSAGDFPLARDTSAGSVAWRGAAQSEGCRSRARVLRDSGTKEPDRVSHTGASERVHGLRQGGHSAERQKRAGLPSNPTPLDWKWTC
jgi:hypothetical protein